MKDIYKKITQEILESLKEGIAPWTQPWCSEIPQNAVTKRPYSGINVLVLWTIMAKHQYKTNLWLTFKQAKGANLSVKKGAKGTRVVFVKSVNKQDDEDIHGSDQNDKGKKVVFIMRSFVVFNLDQVTGEQETLDGLYPATIDVDVNEGLFVSAKQWIDQTGAEINQQGNKACFYHKRDMIEMPMIERFYLEGQSELESQSNYYAALFHELTHWTGHHTRLNRDLKGRFGDASYAAEELIAEMGSSFLCAHFGIRGKLQHAAYIKSWVKILENDDRAIFTAAATAQKAVDFLLEKEVAVKVAITG